MVAHAPGSLPAANTSQSSIQDRLAFDSELESISNGLDFLKSRLQGENFYIDPDAFSELFPTSDGLVDSLAPQLLLSNSSDDIDPILTETIQEKDGGSAEKESGNGQEVVQYSRPFSPGQFLNEVFGSSKDSSGEANVEVELLSDGI